MTAKPAQAQNHGHARLNLLVSTQAMFEVKTMANQKGRNPKRKNAPINPPSTRRNKYGELKSEK